MKSLCDKFARRLNPSVLREIESWSDHPQLSKLLQKLVSITDAQRFLDCYAEAIIARHLFKQGCTLEVEVPTVSGRSADFKVSKDDHVFFLHIKRHNAEGQTAEEIRLQSRLQDLRKIPRPVILGIQFLKTPSDSEMQRVYSEARRFLNQGSLGESVVVSGMHGVGLAELQLRESPSSKRVGLVMAMSPRFGDDQKRFYKKLSEAYKQSMPNALNVILVTSPWKDDIEDLDSALLGTTFEERDIQWKVIERGRKNDGFWSGGKHPHCQAVGWFTFGIHKDYIYLKMWYRENSQVPASLLQLFGPATS